MMPAVSDRDGLVASPRRALEVLIFPLGSRGDIHPLVGLGRELHRRGHDVTVGANSGFSDLVEQAGLRFVEVGRREELEAAFADNALWRPYRGFWSVVKSIVMPAMRPQFELIAERYRPGRTLVVASTCSLGARVAHDKLGVPLVTVHVQPMVLWSDYRSPVVGPLLMADWVPRALKRLQFRCAAALTVNRWILRRTNEFRAELGLPPLRSLADLMNSPQKVIGMFPDWFAARQPDWPAQLELTGFPLWDDAEHHEPSTELEQFLAEGQPPIVFTISTTIWRAREFYEAAVAACRILGRRGVLLAADPEHVPPALPPSVRRFGYVPLRRLLPRVAALVHHGGLGTGAMALAAGIPQVARPVSFDQPDNAARLRRLGVSETVGHQLLGGQPLARALDRLLRSPEVGRRCTELAARIHATRGLALASDVIEELGSRDPLAQPHGRSEPLRVSTGRISSG